MAIRLPPLQTLRAFDAAAHTLSFTLAARELNVTQSAVSQQIRGLEAYLGVTLFHRHVRELSLTDEGRVLAEATRQAIDTISAAAMRLQDTAPAGQLTISCLPSFSTQWLVPRLGRFRRLYPNLTVKLLASWHLVDFRSQDVDLAIRWGKGDWAGLESEEFLQETIFPVCSPKLRSTFEFAEPKNIINAPLLFDSDLEHEEWESWFTAAQVEVELPFPWLLFESSVDMIQAAIAGEGVALVPSALTESEIAAGRLVRLFETQILSPFSYHLVVPPTRSSIPKVEAFRQWLMQERLLKHT